MLTVKVIFNSNPVFQGMHPSWWYDVLGNFNDYSPACNQSHTEMLNASRTALCRISPVLGLGAMVLHCVIFIFWWLPYSPHWASEKDKQKSHWVKSDQPDTRRWSPLGGIFLQGALQIKAPCIDISWTYQIIWGWKILPLLDILFFCLFFVFLQDKRHVA